MSSLFYVLSGERTKYCWRGYSPPYPLHSRLPLFLNFGQIRNLISQNAVVAETAIFAARAHNLKDIVLTGNLTTLPHVRAVFENLSDAFGVKFIFPENSQFGTVIGTALHPID